MRTRGVAVIGLALLATGLVLMGLASNPGRTFETHGERIYFTGRDEGGARIAYEGTPFRGMPAGALSCAACHGGNAEGGRHRMHMLVMDAPDIRWSTITAEAASGGEHGRSGEYDLAAFRRAVVEGQHPDGQPLSDLMPRWKLSDRDLADLVTFLQSLDD